MLAIAARPLVVLNVIFTCKTVRSKACRFGIYEQVSCREQLILARSIKDLGHMKCQRIEQDEHQETRQSRDEDACARGFHRLIRGSESLQQFNAVPVRI